MIAEALQEARESRGITDAQVMAETGADVVELGLQERGVVAGDCQGARQASPRPRAAPLAAVTYDVSHYLKNPGVRDVIEAGVRSAVTPNVETVVVGHSLGSVVTYNLLRREGHGLGWKVPLYVTVGSPLAVNAISTRLQPPGLRRRLVQRYGPE